MTFQRRLLNFMVTMLSIAVTVLHCTSSNAKNISRTQTLPSRFGWTTDKWNGDDRPFARLRQTIDKEASNTNDLDVLLAKYKNKGKSAPSDPQAQFAWGYAAWLSRKKFTGREEQYKRVWEPMQSLARVASPHSYEFTRLRFLFEAWAGAFPEMEDVGQRLVRRNPKDYDVKYYLVKVLSVVATPDSKRQALSYVQEFMRTKPKKISYYTLLGGVYELSWYKNRGKYPDDAKNAIATYRKYLQMAPPDDPYRREVLDSINFITKTQAKWDKRGA